MKKVETALILARAIANFEVIEIDDKALTVVGSGPLSSEFDKLTSSNGNCGCAPGSTVPSGTYTNANCGCG